MEIKKLGEGAFGNVHLYESVRDRREIAVKSIEVSEENLQTIQVELAVLITLKHKNIIQCIGFDEGPGQIHILLEYMSSGSLASRCPLNIPDALECTKDVLEGLVFLHGEEVIHRDIKGDNILYDGTIWKISDFGLSKIVENDDLFVLYYAGTPGYMAPEIRQKGSSFDYKVDIWSLGCTVIEMFDPGSPMFQDPNWEFDLDELPLDVPDEFHGFLSACFEWLPSQRATAAHLLEGPPFHTS